MNISDQSFWANILFLLAASFNTALFLGEIPSDVVMSKCVIAFFIVCLACFLRWLYLRFVLLAGVSWWVLCDFGLFFIWPSWHTLQENFIAAGCIYLCMLLLTVACEKSSIPECLSNVIDDITCRR